MATDLGMSVLSHSLLLVDSRVRCRDSDHRKCVCTVSRRTRGALIRDEEPRHPLPRIQPRLITAPVAVHLHHPTADSARVSALPVTSVGQDNERTRPVTETVSPIPHLHFLSLTVCAGQLNFLSRCAL